MDVGETTGHVFIVSHNGVEVLECFCGDSIWQIEHYPPKSNIIAQCCKKTQSTIAKPKPFQNKQIVVFLLHVMLVIGLQLKVY